MTDNTTVNPRLSIEPRPLYVHKSRALALARQDNETGEIAVVGGAAIYDVFRPLADRIEVTEIHAEYEGDTFMKPLTREWEVTAREYFEAEGDYPSYSFVTYHRAADESEEDAD